MSTTITKVVQTFECPRAGGQYAEIVEERVYASDDRLPDVGGPMFHLLNRRCSLARECNLAGCHCQFAYLNPNYAPVFGQFR